MAAEAIVKRDFGSFHSSNVQDLISLPKNKYIPPKSPIPLPSLGRFEKDKIQFGRSIKEDLFYLEEECCFLNHGAFGAALKPALEVARLWQLYTERQPLRFLDREFLPLLVHVCRRLADFVDCDPSDIVLTSNATFGTNSVLSSTSFKPGDVILSFNVTYGAVKKLVNHVCATTGAVNKEVALEFPVTGNQQILSLFEKHLESAEDIKLVLIDHIPSNTPFIMPVKEMVRMCRQRNIKVFIDGAHSLGALPLSINDIDPDFYVSNAHKWFCCPKGVAFLYVKKELQSDIHPSIISHGFGSGFNGEFAWIGLKDYSPMLALHTVLDFWIAQGPDRIRKYIHGLARDGASLLMQSWNSKLIAPLEMFGSMVLVGLPDAMHDHFDVIDYGAAEFIQNLLFYDHNVEIPVKSIEGRLYVRISAHIHNDIDDYERLAKSIDSILEKLSTSSPPEAS